MENERSKALSFFTLCTALCMAILLTIPSSAQPPAKAAATFLRDGKLDVDAVVRHFEDLYRSASSISVAELTVTRPRRTRTMTMKVWTKGRDKALIVIQQPVREAGTATLKVDDNLWNYLPRIKRTIRIPPSMMLASWMGSDFTNDDLVRDSSFIDDYEYQLVGRSNDPPGWLVRFDARPGLVGLWNGIELVVSEDGAIPLHARYYDRRDRLARTMHWDDVRVFDGRRLPAHMTLVPEDEVSHRTEMRYRTIQFDVDVPESTFSLSNLERQR
jgi:outer membrane lipoprotein-sorting protein